MAVPPLPFCCQTKMKKKNILFFAYMNSHLAKILSLAKILKQKSNYNPIIVFLGVYESPGGKSLAICKDKKIMLLDRAGNPIDCSERNRNSESANVGQLGLSDKLAVVFKKVSPLYVFARAIFSLLLPAVYFVYLRRKIKFYAGLINTYKPKAIIVPEENVILQTQVLTRTAQKQGVPTLILPYTIANYTEFCEALYREPSGRVRGIFDLLVKWRFSKWIRRYKKRQLILMRGWRILIYELFRFSPPNPWQINSGFAKAIAVESTFMKEYYLKNGLPVEQLVLTGAPEDDFLYEKLETKQKRIGGRRILLCSLPPSQLPRPKCDFKNYENLVKFWTESLGRVLNYHIIVSLHPRLSLSEMKYLEKYGVEVTGKNVVELIPFCDIYVASVSATIRWAIACGKPVLNYDVYKYRYHDYDSAKGVITVESKADFSKYLKRMTENKKYLRELAELQKSSSRNWGILDGKSGARIIKLIDSLCKK